MSITTRKSPLTASTVKGAVSTNENTVKTEGVGALGQLSPSERHENTDQRLTRLIRFFSILSAEVTRKGPFPL